MSEKSFEDRMFEADLTGVDVTDAAAIADLLDLHPDEAVSDTGETEGAVAAETETAPVAAEVGAEAVAPKESSVSPDAATGTQNDIAGVLTKDGKHVIPHAVLSAERTEKIHWREAAAAERARAEQAEQKLEDALAGRSPKQEALTEEIVAQREADFPEHGKELRAAFEQIKAAQASVKAQPARNIAQETQAEVAEAEQLDIAIMARPLLAQYRDRGGVVWARAVEMDNELAAAHPDRNERFILVEQQLAAELGIPVSTPIPQAAAKAAPARPRATPTPTAVMPTLTDFNGSGVSIKSDNPFEGISDGQMVDKAMNMNLNDLRAMVGLS